jgi:hypothetical protein
MAALEVMRPWVCRCCGGAIVSNNAVAERHVCPDCERLLEDNSPEQMALRSVDSTVQPHLAKDLTVDCPSVSTSQELLERVGHQENT